MFRNAIIFVAASDSLISHDGLKLITKGLVIDHFESGIFRFPITYRFEYQDNKEEPEEPEEPEDCTYFYTSVLSEKEGDQVVIVKSYMFDKYIVLEHGNPMDVPFITKIDENTTKTTFTYKEQKNDSK